MKMNQTAVVIGEQLPIQHACTTPDGLHWLEIPVTGWDEVKHHAKKIISFDGRDYGWSCWNSDRMVSVFRNPLFPIARFTR